MFFVSGKGLTFNFFFTILIVTWNNVLHFKLLYLLWILLTWMNSSDSMLSFCLFKLSCNLWSSNVILPFFETMMCLQFGYYFRLMEQMGPHMFKDWGVKYYSRKIADLVIQRLELPSKSPLERCCIVSCVGVSKIPSSYWLTRSLYWFFRTDCSRWFMF